MSPRSPRPPHRSPNSPPAGGAAERNNSSAGGPEVIRNVYETPRQAVESFVQRIDFAHSASKDTAEEYDADWDWTDRDHGLDGGAALLDLALRVQEPDYELRPYEKDFLGYMSGVVQRVEAKAGVNEKGIITAHTMPGEDEPAFSEAIKAEMPSVASSLEARLQRATQQKETLTDQQGVEAQKLDRRIRALNGDKRRMDLLTAAGDDSIADEAQTGNKFMEAARRVDVRGASAGSKEGKTFSALRRELRAQDNLNQAEAGFYRQVAHYQGGKFKSDAFTPPRVTSRTVRIEPLTRAREEAAEEAATAPVQTPERPPVEQTPQQPNTTEPAKEKKAGKKDKKDKEGKKDDDGGDKGNRATADTAPKPESPEQVSLKALEIRMENAIKRMARSGGTRSRTFVGAEFVDRAANNTDPSQLDEHDRMILASYDLMEAKHPEYFNPAVPAKERGALISSFLSEQYGKATDLSLQNMGGERDPKKRMRNNWIIRGGATAVGFVLGGPAGAVVGGAAGLAYTKAKDHEYKKRAGLADAIKSDVTETAVDDYVNSLGTDGTFNSFEAFLAASNNLRQQFEVGFVQQRRKNILAAGAIGVAWFAGSVVLAAEAADVMSYMGSEIRHGISTFDNPLGHPGYNYIPHPKPNSVSFFEWFYNTGGKLI